MSYSEKGFAEAVELARNGNAHAQHHLKRIAKRDPNSPMGRTARQVLDEKGITYAEQ
jgi:hypothetical protein